MKKVVTCLALLVLSGQALGGRIRDGGDPPPETVLFADPFDNYSQWAVDNGNLWVGGPVPAGSPAGVYPPKTPSGENCDPLVRRQTSPSRDQYARQYWPKMLDCIPPGVGVSGISALNINLDGECAPPDDPEDKVTSTWPFYGNVDNVWGVGSYYTAMAMYTHSFKDRIQAIDPTKNAVNGTNENPLILTFYLHDSAPNLDPGNNRGPSSSCYVDMSFANEHAPTDYIWRGDPTKTLESGDPEACPQGPYPIVCQQVREININAREGQPSQDEQQVDLDYLNTHCGPLKNRTWNSIAFGMLAIIDKEPCVVDAATSHKPVNGRMSVFDGYAWRQIRDGRYRGLADSSLGDIATSGLPFPPEDYMVIDEQRDCNRFGITTGGKNVTLKITTDYILAYMQTTELVSGVPTLRGWHAAIPRAYKGPFNRISFGVAPGCEIDAATGECKVGGTPTACLRYSTDKTQGYWRSNVDNIVIHSGVLVYEQEIGACCRDGQCTIEDSGVCAAAGGVHRGVGTTCETDPCKGACCGSMGTCADVNYGACSGRFQGIGSRCAQTTCPCPVPFADYDEDNDVDQDDFGRFQACFNPSGMTPGCGCYDRNNDQKVDLEDFQKFVNCVSGPEVPITNPATCGN